MFVTVAIYFLGAGSSNGKKANGKALQVINEKQIPAAYLPEFRLPLVWIDLEMTGKNV